MRLLKAVRDSVPCLLQSGTVLHPSSPASYLSSKEWLLILTHIQPFGGGHPPTTASADFSSSILPPLDGSSLAAEPEISPGITHPPSRLCPPHIRPCLPDRDWALKILAFSPDMDASCENCASGQRFACGFLQIPPRERHPCRPASDSSYQGSQGTCTPKWVRPAGRTKKKPRGFPQGFPNR